MKHKSRMHFTRLVALLSLASLIGGCSLSPREATDTPAPPLPSVTVQPVSTPPKVIIITPTAGGLLPGLEAVPGAAFCADEQVQAALQALQTAVITQDGTGLAAVVDPLEGLDIYYRLANAPVTITPEEIPGLFSNTFTYSWGDQAGSGLPVEGTFSSEILPGLLDVFERDHQAACQDLSTGIGSGPTTARVEWPAAYAGMPYIALYRPPGSADNELDWRTWAVGFTVVNGQPKIRVLVQYVWEI